MLSRSGVDSLVGLTELDVREVRTGLVTVVRLRRDIVLVRWRRVRRINRILLPEPEVDRRFDLVYCYATLHYVEAVERALRALYELVRPGGHLVFNYPNRLTRAEYRRLSSGDAERGRGGPTRKVFSRRAAERRRVIS